MIDFLKRLYKKRSNVTDTLTNQIWSIAAESRDDVSLKDYRKWLCETYDFSEQDIDTLYSVYCHQIPEDSQVTSWNADIESFALSIGISQDIFDRTKNHYPLAMMFRAHVRLLSKNQYDPNEDLAKSRIERLETFLSVFEGQFDDMEYKDMIESFKVFEARVENFVNLRGDDLDDLDFNVAVSDYLEVEKYLASVHKEYSSEGTDKDEIPNGIGEFGLEPTNPIPASSIREGYSYLKNLSTASSEISYTRIGSLSVDNISGLVDEYQIYSNEKELCKLYINSYNLKTSKKLPRGFIWKS